MNSNDYEIIEDFYFIERILELIKGDINSGINQKKYSLYIESILLGLPLMPIVLDGTGNYELIKVFERLKAIYFFIIKEHFNLKGLNQLKHLEGYYYKSLKNYEKGKIKETYIPVINLTFRTNESLNFFKKLY